MVRALGDCRNVVREKAAHAKDAESLTSKYLIDDPTEFLFPPIQGPNNFFKPPTALLANIRAVAEAPTKVPKAPGLKFGTAEEDLKENDRTLKRHGFNL